MRTHRLVPALLLLLVVIGSSGCLGGDDDSGTPGTSSTRTQGSTAPTPTPITAEGVLAAAAERWDETDSAHFNLTVDGDAFVDDDQTIALRAADGDILRPDSVEATAKLGVSLVTLDVSMIAVSNDMWITNFVNGRWEEAPPDFGYNPALLFSDTDGIGPVLKKLQSPKLEDDEDVDGTNAHVVSGTVDRDAIDKITAGAIENDNVPVTVWIADETSDILKIVITGATTAEAEESTWTLLVNDHNDPVEIEPPELGT
jgi:hypothetical protein